MGNQEWILNVGQGVPWRKGGGTLGLWVPWSLPYNSTSSWWPFADSELSLCVELCADHFRKQKHQDLFILRSKNHLFHLLLGTLSTCVWVNDTAESTSELKLSSQIVSHPETPWPCDTGPSGALDPFLKSQFLPQLQEKSLQIPLGDLCFLKEKSSISQAQSWCLSK